MSSGKLGEFLREVSNWDWEQFVRAENDGQYTTNQSVIFSLVRACAMQKMDAIRLSLNRLDGKLKTPIKIEYPKVYYLYPNAKVTALPGDDDVAVIEPPVEEVVDALAPIETATLEEEDLPSMGLRETLRKMADYPRNLPEAIIQLAEQTHQYVQGNAPRPDEIPKVKSVIAAHLLTMAQQRNMDALYEIFDAIDGKLVETLQVLGEDIYITSYASVAPDGARLNKDGILQIEAVQAQDLWAQKLSRGKE